jgi:lipid-A-disaccharide synthase
MSNSLFSELNLFICAGEASGDSHGAEIILALKELLNASDSNINLKAWGMGGAKLKEAGLEIIQDSTNLGIIGIADIIKNLLFFIQLEKRLIQELIDRKPQIALFIDYPGLNLRLAKAIKKHLPNCKIIYYVAPQVWAWNEGRLKQIPNLVDRLFPILPFEEELHKKAGTSVKYVGNPSAWIIGQVEKIFDKQKFFDFMGFDSSKPLIGIFPGSRKREIDYMLPVFLEAAKELNKTNPEIQFLLVRANSIKQKKIEEYLKKHKIKEDLIKVSDSKYNHYILKGLDIAWLTSGTVTLEAACCETPLILGYRENPLYWPFYLLVRKIDKIGLPNIIADENICPELLQEDCIVENWVNITKQWLSEPELLDNIKKDLREKVKAKLKPELDPTLYIAQEIQTIYQISQASLINASHIKKQAEINSAQTKKQYKKNE